MSHQSETVTVPNVGKSVVLVGFQDQGNLGLGYLAAVLIENGYRVHIVDIRQGLDTVLASARKHEPLLVGFSLIFQYYLYDFARLASFLRSMKVNCHFTIGGHYPSLRYEQTLNEIPELDSVVLFEGEVSLLELVDHLSAGQNWREINGIAYRTDKGVVVNPLQSLTPDLNELPFPYRPFEADDLLGKKILPILATRGCPRNCAFCSIREFYKQAPGKLVRRRKPENVVQEMKELYEHMGVSIFLFQDDDFPLMGKAGRRWVYAFIDALDRQQLMHKVIWKISCRVDEVGENLFSDMKEAGLYLVYLGIESGTDSGLATLNKQVKVIDNFNAVTILKNLDLMIGYGFMLFDPESTFDTVHQNIQFLRQIIGDGSAAVVFCKMLPYAGTPIEKTLSDTSRIKGSIVQPDYNFHDPLLDTYYAKIDEELAPLVHGADSVSHNLELVRHELVVIKRLFPNMTGMQKYEEFLQAITKQHNELVFSVLEQSARQFEQKQEWLFHGAKVRNMGQRTVDTLIDQRNQFVYNNRSEIQANMAESRTAHI